MFQMSFRQGSKTEVISYLACLRDQFASLQSISADHSTVYRDRHVAVPLTGAWKYAYRLGKVFVERLQKGT